MEHFLWKKLPEEVFAALGGKEVAKTLRKASQGKGTIDVTEKVAATTDNSNTTNIKTENDVSSKKRTSDDFEKDIFISEEDELNPAKRQRMSNSIDSDNNWQNANDGMLDFGSLKNEYSEIEPERETLKQGISVKQKQLPVEVLDLTGRNFVPLWRRSKEEVHQYSDTSSITVNWFLL